jgi:hypothetical protein
MNRVKAIYRSWGIPCAGQRVYDARHREEWLSKITHPSVRRWRSEDEFGTQTGLQKSSSEKDHRRHEYQPGGCSLFDRIDHISY